MNFENTVQFVLKGTKEHQPERVMKNGKIVIPLLNKSRRQDDILVVFSDEDIPVPEKYSRILHKLKLCYEAELSEKDASAIIASTICAFPDTGADFISDIAGLFRERWGSIERQIAVAHGSIAGTIKSVRILELRDDDAIVAKSMELWATVLESCGDFAEMPKDMLGEISNDLHRYLGGFEPAQSVRIFKSFLTFLEKEHKDAFATRLLLDQFTDLFNHILFGRLHAGKQSELLLKVG